MHTGVLPAFESSIALMQGGRIERAQELADIKARGIRHHDSADTI
jgi:hypothetical protein